MAYLIQFQLDSRVSMLMVQAPPQAQLGVLMVLTGRDRIVQASTLCMGQCHQWPQVDWRRQKDATPLWFIRWLVTQVMVLRIMWWIEMMRMSRLHLLRGMTIHSIA